MDICKYTFNSHSCKDAVFAVEQANMQRSLFKLIHQDVLVATYSCFISRMTVPGAAGHVTVIDSDVVSGYVPWDAQSLCNMDLSGITPALLVHSRQVMAPVDTCQAVMHHRQGAGQVANIPSTIHFIRALGLHIDVMAETVNATLQKDLNTPQRLLRNTHMMCNALPLHLLQVN